MAPMRRRRQDLGRLPVLIFILGLPYAVGIQGRHEDSSFLDILLSNDISTVSMSASSTPYGDTDFTGFLTKANSNVPITDYEQSPTTKSSNSDGSSYRTPPESNSASAPPQNSTADEATDSDDTKASSVRTADVWSTENGGSWSTRGINDGPDLTTHATYVSTRDRHDTTESVPFTDHKEQGGSTQSSTEPVAPELTTDEPADVSHGAWSIEPTSDAAGPQNSPTSAPDTSSADPSLTRHPSANTSPSTVDDEPQYSSILTPTHIDHTASLPSSLSASETTDTSITPTSPWKTQSVTTEPETAIPSTVDDQPQYSSTLPGTPTHIDHTASLPSSRSASESTVSSITPTSPWKTQSVTTEPETASTKVPRNDPLRPAEIAGLVFAGILVVGLIVAFVIEGLRSCRLRRNLSPDRWPLEDVREMSSPASPYDLSAPLGDE